jgi:hypothetical protein
MATKIANVTSQPFLLQLPFLHIPACLPAFKLPRGLGRRSQAQTELSWRRGFQKARCFRRKSSRLGVWDPSHYSLWDAGQVICLSFAVYLICQGLLTMMSLQSSEFYDCIF